MSQLVKIIRGAPGSGKTQEALKAVELAGFKHHEADHYFTERGVYTFDPSKLPEAHAQCLSDTVVDLHNGHNVVVSNTFTKWWEFRPYMVAAAAVGAEVEIIHMTEEYGNTHGVPEEVVERMKSQFEPLSVYSKFDFKAQKFFFFDGKEDTEHSGCFPCKKCQGPADITHITSYHEHHKCNVCGTKFVVN